MLNNKLTTMLCAVLAFAFVVALPAPVQADTEINLSKSPKRSFAFSALFGIKGEPGYFTSSEMEARPAFRFTFLNFRSKTANFGEGDASSDDPFARRKGWVTGLSFGYVASRKSSDYPELAGLNDIDGSIEAGIGVGYALPNFEVLGTARYGLTGHNAWTGNLRAFYVARPADRLTLRIGPIIEFGTDSYVATYFGVTASEALASSFMAYDPSGGLYSAGIDFIATYKLADGWWMEFGARWDALQGDAANSPLAIQGSDTRTSVRFGFRRAFSINF